MKHYRFSRTSSSPFHYRARERPSQNPFPPFSTYNQFYHLQPTLTDQARRFRSPDHRAVSPQVCQHSARLSPAPKANNNNRRDKFGGGVNEGWNGSTTKSRKRKSLKKVSSDDHWVYTDKRDVVDMATVTRENLRRLFMYIDKLPLIVPESLFDIYDSHIRWIC